MFYGNFCTAIPEPLEIYLNRLKEILEQEFCSQCRCLNRMIFVATCLCEINQFTPTWLSMIKAKSYTKMWL